MSTFNYLCETCKHYNRNSESYKCDAFPNGIPKNHDCWHLVTIEGKIGGNASPPKDCGNGYKYEVHPDTVKYREEWKRDEEAGISMPM